MWRYRYIHLIAVSVVFVFPAILGFPGAAGSRPLVHSSLRGWHASSFSSTAPFASIRSATISANARIPPDAAPVTRGLWHDLRFRPRARRPGLTSVNRLLPLSVAQTHWKTGLFTPNADSSPGRVIGCWSRPRKPAPRTPEFDFIRPLEAMEDVLGNLCLVLV
jgi:hypothetical protein